jgi:hypothetical protein
VGFLRPERQVQDWLEPPEWGAGALQSCEEGLVGGFGHVCRGIEIAVEILDRLIRQKGLECLFIQHALHRTVTLSGGRF